MSMKEWAEKEINIFKRETDEYGRFCCNSALKAYNSLLEDGHSGASIMYTLQILDRLVKGQCLTPIDDADDIWGDILSRYDDDIKSYQCKRMSSLFKYVKPDGTVIYRDIQRVVKRDLENGTTWHSGLCDRIVEELYPIKMPYLPESKPYIVESNDILFDPSHGDFDTVCIHSIKKPDGEEINIGRYFRESHKGEIEIYPGWVEISEEEWVNRYKNRVSKEKTKCNYMIFS